MLDQTPMTPAPMRALRLRDELCTHGIEKNIAHGIVSMPVIHDHRPNNDPINLSPSRIVRIASSNTKE
jgi:hypothetical protein